MKPLEPLRISVEELAFRCGAAAATARRPRLLCVRPRRRRRNDPSVHGGCCGRPGRTRYRHLAFSVPFIWKNGGRRTDVPSGRASPLYALRLWRRFKPISRSAASRRRKILWRPDDSHKHKRCSRCRTCRGWCSSAFHSTRPRSRSIERATTIPRGRRWVPDAVYTGNTCDKLAGCPAFLDRKWSSKLWEKMPSLHEIAGADHSLHAPLRSGRRAMPTSLERSLG